MSVKVSTIPVVTLLCMTQDAAFDLHVSSSAEEIFCGDPRCQCGNPTCSCGPQNQCQYIRNYGKHANALQCNT